MNINIKLFFFIALITLIAYGSVDRGNDPRKVVGIEFKQNFNHTGLLQNNFFCDVKTVKCIIDLYFGKVALDVPVGLSATFSSFCVIMKAGDKEWPISRLNGHKKYNYTNIYGSGSLPSQADIYVRYHNFIAQLSLNSNNYAGPKVFDKYITTIPLYQKDNDSMKFIKLSIDFSDMNINSFENITTLSSFQGEYPMESFINDYPTTSVVRVIDPNSSYYGCFCNVINSSTNNIPSMVNDLDDYTVEVTLGPGQLLTMPDTNGCFCISSNMNGDYDRDGLTDEEEFLLFYTNPFLDDTDGDGLTDYEEIYGRNIILHFLNGDENRKIVTTPFWYDSDGDGIADGDECLGLFPYEDNGVINNFITDPCSYDTDGDGLNDKEDIHPLIPCFNPEDTSVSSEWASYWQRIANEAGVAANDIFLPNGDCDGDGVNNITEMKNGSCPVFTNGFRKYIFEPQTLNIPISESGIITNNFVLKIFSENFLTGAVFIGSTDWHPSLIMNELSPMWLDCPVLTENKEVVTFICKNYNELYFSLIIDFSRVNKSVLLQNIKIVDTIGCSNAILPVNLVPPAGMSINEAPTQPILSVPSDNATVHLEYHDVSENDPDPIVESIVFSWLPATDPENEDVTYTINVYQNSTDFNYFYQTQENSHIISTDDYKFECGYCYWNVIAADEAGNERASEIGCFFVDIPGDEDEDGFDNSSELKFGSDPFDKTSVPLSIDTDNLKNGFVGREYFQRLKASGGNNKKYNWLNSYESVLPNGLSVSEEGEIRGVPLTTETRQVKMIVTDGAVKTNKTFNITIYPPRNGLILRPGGGGITEKLEND